MEILIGLLNNMGSFTFILSVFLIIDINSGELSYYIILFAINESVIPLLNSEFTVSVSIPPICCTHNLPLFKSEKLRSFSLGEKRIPYRLRSRYSTHFNAPR
jgi:hypothetical protein